MKLILTIQAFMNQWTKSQLLFLYIWTALLLGLSVWCAYKHGQAADRAWYYYELFNKHNTIELK